MKYYLNYEVNLVALFNLNSVSYVHGLINRNINKTNIYLKRKLLLSYTSHQTLTYISEYFLQIKHQSKDRKSYNIIIQDHQ